MNNNTNKEESLEDVLRIPRKKIQLYSILKGTYINFKFN